MAQKKKDQQIDFEISFFEGVLQKSPRFTEALAALGDLYTKKGLYRRGLCIDQKLSLIRPDDPTILYNLSCSYSLLEQIENAFEAMKRAVACGYANWRFLERDRDLVNLRKDQRFSNYLSKQKNRSGHHE